MIKLPPKAFVAVFNKNQVGPFVNGDIAVCFKVIRDNRTRAVKIYGFNEHGGFVKGKEIPIVDWNFYLKQNHVKVLSKIEQEGFVDAIRDIYEAVTGKKG